METNDAEKLAREAVMARAPQAAERLVRGLLLPRLKAAASPEQARADLSASCRGAIGGYLLSEQDLGDGAVAILTALGEAVSETSLDPAEALRWALEGMAEASLSAPAGGRDAMSERIDGAFLGAGSLFAELCERAGAPALP